VIKTKADIEKLDIYYPVVDDAAIMINTGANITYIDPYEVTRIKGLDNCLNFIVFYSELPLTYTCSIHDTKEYNMLNRYVKRLNELSTNVYKLYRNYNQGYTNTNMVVIACNNKQEPMK
jgi:hypothetical protein